MKPRTLALLASLFAVFTSFHGAAAERTARLHQRFQVTVEGNGPDVVLIPGLASSAEVWQSTIATLRAHYRVHVIQLRGFAGLAAGENAKGPVLSAFVDELAHYISDEHVTSPVIVGHSMGGAAALMLAARYRGLAGRILVIDSLPFYPLIMNPAATVDSVRASAVSARDALLAMSTEQFQAAQRAGAARLVKNESARAKVASAAANSDARVVAHSMHELMTTDLRPELSAVSVPVLVLYAYDTMYGVPPAAVDELFKGAYKTLRTARFQRIDNTFHFIMYDQQQMFADALENFLRAKPAVADQ